LPALAADLVKRNVAVIGCGGGYITTLAARKATSTIPIVFDTGADPVALGMVKSLARPGGNATGYFVVTSGLVGKRIGLLREMAPGGGTIAAIIVTGRPATGAQLGEIREAEKSVGQKFKIIDMKDADGIPAALSPAATAGAASLLVGADPLLFGHRQEVVNLLAKLRLPAIYEWPQYVEIGGLMSYGANLADAYRQVGDYVGKILHGAKPADLPIAEPTRCRCHSRRPSAPHPQAGRQPAPP
jgi:putative ABC transport system substrate-binding protein